MLKYIRNYYLKVRHKIISVIRLGFTLIVRKEIYIKEYQNYALVNTSRGVTDALYLNLPLIVSLTTYGQRINDVYLVIESIFNQTIKPNRVILWLDREEFRDDNIPITLFWLKERGLEIRYYENIKSYKKIIPTIEVAPISNIITIDDDVLYPHDFIEKFIGEYKKDKKCIYFYRGRQIIIKKGKILPYNRWPFAVGKEVQFNVLPTGIGGVFYPSGCFDSRVTDKEMFMSLCPNADDVWLRAMTMLRGYSCKKIDIPGLFEESFISINRSQDSGLSGDNFFNNANDKQIKAVFDYFNIDVSNYRDNKT